MRMGLLLIVSAGLLAADPSKDEGTKPAQHDGSVVQVKPAQYVRAEIQGDLVPVSNAGVRFGILISVRPKLVIYLLSVRELKEWNEDKLGRGPDLTVRVTGPLEFAPVVTSPGVIEEQPMIVAKTLEFVKNKGDDRKPPAKGGLRIINDDTPFYARVEIQGTLKASRPKDVSLTVAIGGGPKTVTLPLSVSQLKDWTEEKLEKSTGKVVRVTGTLDLVEEQTKPGLTKDRLIVVAKTLELVRE